ncbi:hypothetical protein H2Y56_06035 [Pectobacterium aroidearum]|uniref:Adenylate cyclase n=1 Tax=Pectobacterium aroidearum TaxID=1201031 RepID=A0ABR5ZAS5_9GAMM|nr:MULTISPECIES: hypothetical protein [Pectobacterium]MBA5198886.1 hypothetical protein [Pectobacterium aroidearum]MBA5231678.1 hypothetical protein [Pectobacterium aroidearum]MBA5736856.1 hypothetical protein [Pectobacterium aroidearum]UXJ98915.1 hypothetical protein N5056_13900 [Pectobacterium aroidearum]GKV93549.1 hypothetical protein PEC301645_09960 [Pectobacterium carotovorum subsp. carotovorum]
MLTRIDRITYRNGFRLNGQPVSIEDVEPVFDGRRAAALSVWEQYEKSKAALKMLNLSNEEYQDAVRRIADALGI